MPLSNTVPYKTSNVIQGLPHGIMTYITYKYRTRISGLYRERVNSYIQIPVLKLKTISDQLTDKRHKTESSFTQPSITVNNQSYKQGAKWGFQAAQINAVVQKNAIVYQKQVFLLECVLLTIR